MKTKNIILTLVALLYVTTTFAFQVSPDSGAAKLVASIFGEYFLTLNAYAAGATLLTGAIVGMIGSVPGFVKLVVAVIVSLVGAVLGWFFSQGIFIGISVIEALKIGWSVAGGSTLIHAIIKEVGLLNIIKGFFTKSNNA